MDEEEEWVDFNIDGEDNMEIRYHDDSLEDPTCSSDRGAEEWRLYDWAKIMLNFGRENDKPN